MSSQKNQPKATRHHARNKNRDKYDLGALLISHPELADYVTPNKNGEDSVDFSNPMAVRILNKALLHHYYGIPNWEFPDTYLSPSLPVRADYIHHVADLLCESNFGTIPTGDKITCFDIGVGASCIYPIIGITEYDWQFIGSDSDPLAIESARHIVQSNPSLQDRIECKVQTNTKDVFYGIIGREDKIDVSICNPPVHSATEELPKGTRKKDKSLTDQHIKAKTLNLTGIHKELLCDGGETKFITNMIRESKKFAKNCYWFSTLVSKQSNLKGIYKALETLEATQIKTIPMGLGNKSSRIVAWTFLSKEEQKAWKLTRWKKKAPHKE